MDAMELEAARHAIRLNKEREAVQSLQATHRKNFDSHLLTQSRKDIADLLGEVAAPASIREGLQQLRKQPEQRHHRKRYDQEL